MVPINYYIILSAILFGIGTLGVLVRRNALVIFMSIELMLNAVNLSIIAFSRYGTFDTAANHTSGHVLAFLVMAVAAAEAAVGLAIIVNVFRHRRSIDVDGL